MDFRGEEDPRRDEAPPRGRRRPPRSSPLLLLLVVLIVALLAVAAVLLYRSLGDRVSGTSVAKDSIDSAGPKPDVRITNAAGKVRVEGVEGSNSVEYEATRYAMGSDPATAKQHASEVPVDISREDSRINIETDGGRGTGADYALRIPAGGSVEIESEAGDLEVSGLTGNVKVAAEDTKDLTLQTRVGSVLRESPDEKQGT